MLLAFALKCSVDCRACRISIPLNGIAPSARCYHCGEVNDLGGAFWPSSLRRESLVQALALPAGERRRIAVLESGFHAEFGYQPLACPHCNGALDPGGLSAFIGAGACACPSCGASLRVRAADAVCTAIYSTARYVVGESAPDANGQALQAKTNPVVFQCMSCGGALQVDGTTRLVACRFCNNGNYLPDGLWQMLNPVPKPEFFFLIAEVETLAERCARASQPNLRPDELAALAADSDPNVRRAVARNPVASPEVLQKLSFDASRIVLEGLAENPNIPPSMVEAMAKSDDAEFRVLAVNNPRLSHELLLQLAQDPVETVANTANARIEALRAQGVSISKGFFSKLFR